MSDSNAFGFSQFVPGFDFLKQLSQTPAANAQANHWIAPTLDPAEIEKRIQELKTVMFWLEQNSKAVAASVQALEVQLMTLKTLKGMNLSMTELAKSMQIKPEAFNQKAQEESVKKESPFSWTPKNEAAASSPSSSNSNSKSKSTWPFSDEASPAKSENASHADTKDQAPHQASTDDASQTDQTSTSPDSKATGAAPDPMQWWAALSQQFQTIASKTLTDIQNAQKVQTELAAKAQAELVKNKAADKATQPAQPANAAKNSAVKAKAKTKAKVNAKANAKVTAKTKAKAKAKASVKPSLSHPRGEHTPQASGGKHVLAKGVAKRPATSTVKAVAKAPAKTAPKPRVNPSAFKGLDTLF